MDIQKFQEEAAMYSSLIFDIENAKNEKELSFVLQEALDRIGVKIPWDGDFNSFMNEKKSGLVFE